MDWVDDQLDDHLDFCVEDFHNLPEKDNFESEAENAFLQRYEDQYEEDYELYGIEHSLRPHYIDILDDGYWGAGVSVTKDDHRMAQAQPPPSNIGRAQCTASSQGQLRLKRQAIHHDSKPQKKKNSSSEGVSQEEEQSNRADMLQQPARYEPEDHSRHQVQNHFKISPLSWLNTKRFSKIPATSSIGESSTIWYPGSITSSQSKGTNDSHADDDVISIWEDSVPKLMSIQ